MDCPRARTRSSAAGHNDGVGKNGEIRCGWVAGFLRPFWALLPTALIVARMTHGSEQNPSPGLPKPRSTCTILRGAVQSVTCAAGEIAVGEIRRVSLNGETLRILVEAEMSKHPECHGCTRWKVEAQEPDESGCNWTFKVGAVAGDVVASGCVDQIAAYIAFLKENFGLDNRWSE